MQASISASGIASAGDRQKVCGSLLGLKRAAIVAETTLVQLQLEAGKR
jgi:hypothetical protein